VEDPGGVVTRQQLNLADIDPEDYPGCVVLWQGREFIVGRHIATGAERIVHRLIDAQTGEFGFVIKIQRAPDREAGLTQPSDGEFYLHHKHILVAAVLTLPGGQADIQPRVDTPRHGQRQQLELFHRASELIEAGNEPEALTTLRALLLKFPNDLDAMYNTGALLARAGNAVEALELFKRIVSADPADILARLACLQCARQVSFLDTAEYILWEALSYFPAAETLRRFGIQMYLECGYPEQAVRLIAGSYHLFEQFYGAIIEDFDRKKEVRTRLRSVVGDHVQNQTHIAEAMLVQASEEYPRDPMIRINRAFALRRSGEYREAAELLLSQAGHVRFEAARVCILNAAYCKVAEGMQSEADRLFEYVMPLYILDQESDATPAPPGITNWLDEIDGMNVTMEERPCDTLRLLQTLEPAAPDSARELLFKLYTDLCRQTAERGG
jgi:tetratricopeptide (TPR) repeat protein